MDEKPFASLKQEGYRIIVVWDYREPAFPPSLVEKLEQYREIAVIGWSFGVPAATRFLAVHPELPVSARIAVNGTMHPPIGTRGTVTGVDDTASVMVAWDNGSSLHVIYGEDACRKLQ